jgi:hypothetical protein
MSFLQRNKRSRPAPIGRSPGARDGLLSRLIRGNHATRQSRSNQANPIIPTAGSRQRRPLFGGGFQRFGQRVLSGQPRRQPPAADTIKGRGTRGRRRFF